MKHILIAGAVFGFNLLFWDGEVGFAVFVTAMMYACVFFDKLMAKKMKSLLRFILTLAIIALSFPLSWLLFDPGVALFATPMVFVFFVIYKIAGGIAKAIKKSKEPNFQGINLAESEAFKGHRDKMSDLVDKHIGKHIK